jgi:hypothetical protein
VKTRRTILNTVMRAATLPIKRCLVCHNPLSAWTIARVAGRPGWDEPDRTGPVCAWCLERSDRIIASQAELPGD